MQRVATAVPSPPSTVAGHGVMVHGGVPQQVCAVIIIIIIIIITTILIKKQQPLSP